MSKEENIDRYSPFEEAVKDSAVFVNVLINEQLYPEQFFITPFWLLEFQEEMIVFNEADGKGHQALRKTAASGIEKVELGFVRITPVSVMSGISIALRIEVHFKYSKSIVLLCNSYSCAPEIISWLEKHHISFADPFNLADFFRQTFKERHAYYVYEHIDEMLAPIADKKYHVMYKSFKQLKS